MYFVTIFLSKFAHFTHQGVTHQGVYDDSREEHVEKMWRQLKPVTPERGRGRVLEKDNSGAGDSTRLVKRACARVV
jgi:hypothetical protein